MKPEEQNKAIAELLGWRSNGNRIMAPGQLGWSHVLDGANYPDYLSDLNAAMQAARHFRDQVMDSDQWERFGQLVVAAHPAATLSWHGKPDLHDFATIIADTSAATICECLLKAANLYRD